MGAPTLNLEVVTVVQPAEQHQAEHAWLCQIAAQLRDTQELLRGRRPGHYAIREPRIVYSAVPAAGSDVFLTVPGTTRWKVWGLQATLVTSAAVANRVPHLEIWDPGDVHTAYDVPGLNNQTAGTTVAYSGVPGGTFGFFDNTQVMPLPVEMDLLQGWSIGFETTALQAGDQWTALSMLVTETLYF